jgi:hypothetical protein
VGSWLWALGTERRSVLHTAHMLLGSCGLSTSTCVYVCLDSCEQEGKLFGRITRVCILSVVTQYAGWWRAVALAIAISTLKGFVMKTYKGSREMKL